MRFSVTIIPSEHSEAFREVAEAVHYGLLEHGHESTISEEGDDFDDPAFLETGASRAKPIIFGWNTLEPGGNIPENAILFNLEQAKSHWLKPGPIRRFINHHFWSFSLESMKQLHAQGHWATHVPVGYVRQWERIVQKPEAEKNIDVLFYGCTNERRLAVLTALGKAGLTAVAIFGVYGAERDEYIARSKVVLNVHFYPDSAFEIARCGYLLANHVPVLSEVSRGSDGFDQGVCFVPYDSLVDAAVEMVRHEGNRSFISELGYEVIKARPMTASLGFLPRFP